MPEIDEQIKLLTEQLDKMASVDMSGELIQKDIFKPNSDIAASIMKFECKQLAVQDTLMGLKSVDDITDLSDFLRNVRKLSEKQFKNVYKKQKLMTYQNQQSPFNKPYYPK